LRLRRARPRFAGLGPQGQGTEINAFLRPTPTSAAQRYTFRAGSGSAAEKQSSWPGSSRPSTSFLLVAAKTSMPGTRAGVTAGHTFSRHPEGRALARRLEGSPHALAAHPSRLAARCGERLRMTGVLGWRQQPAAISELNSPP
jgi:hypothetical protein